MDLDKLIDQFLTAREAEGLADTTLDWYKRHLRAYARFVKQSGRQWNDRESVRLFLAALRSDKVRYKEHPYRKPQRKPLSRSSIRAYHRALRAFFRWLISDGVISQNPIENIKPPKLGKNLPKTIDPADFILMLDAARGKPRDEALLLFLADTGVRDEEARNLLVSDIDLVAQRARVTGKGRKQRTVYFTEVTAKAISRYLRLRSSDDPHVFLGQRGPLSVNGIYQILRRLAKKAGVTGRYNPHAFRHFFASQYVANGGDLETLRVMLGHTDIDTTRRYLHFRDEVLRRKHDSFSPISRLSDEGDNDPDS